MRFGSACPSPRRLLLAVSAQPNVTVPIVPAEAEQKAGPPTPCLKEKSEELLMNSGAASSKEPKTKGREAISQDEKDEDEVVDVALSTKKQHTMPKDKGLDNMAGRLHDALETIERYKVRVQELETKQHNLLADKDKKKGEMDEMRRKLLEKEARKVEAEARANRLGAENTRLKEQNSAQQCKIDQLKDSRKAK